MKKSAEHFAYFKMIYNLWGKFFSERHYNCHEKIDKIFYGKQNTFKVKNCISVTLIFRFLHQSKVCPQSLNSNRISLSRKNPEVA